MKVLKPFFIVIFVLVFIIYLYINFSSPKIAYIRSAYIIDNFIGMNEARHNYNRGLSEWKNKLDTLQLMYNLELKEFESNKSLLSQQERGLREITLQRRMDEIYRFSDELDDKAEKENEKLIQGALNQINSFVESYAEKNNIDIVLGITISGNILYGKKTLDITEEVLIGLNKSYK